MMPLNESRSADQQSARRNSADGSESDLGPDPDLEDKTLPPQVPAGSPADLDASRDPPTTQGKVRQKEAKKKLMRKKMKAPEMDDEAKIGSKRTGAVNDLLRLLKEAGMTTGAFDSDDGFDLDLNFDLGLKVIQTTTQDLFSKLKILVGEIPQI
ncbi:Hypothetical protein PHPALM_6128 [Phytophthora palmivora]|uniref:Uncharacterized protein n=1 Tax=Phytophthora palmivora TaxID=4796 RepID=A0A2P4YFN8_9STRA|nr:Hypothetical protein PHPALM_6128 [Phytophthora palmivora]